MLEIKRNTSNEYFWVLRDFIHRVKLNSYIAAKASERKKKTHTHTHTHRRVEFSAIARSAARGRYELNMQIVS